MAAFSGTFPPDPTLWSAEEIAERAQLNGERLFKVYERRVIHGIEYFVIDDMLFAVGAAKSFGGFGAARWPGGTLIYALDASVSARQHDIFLQACALWTAGANVRCLRRTTESTFITVYSGTVNQSRVGYGNGSLIVYNWNILGVVAHELAHAFGMIHEQSRGDRDSYVVTNYVNIEPGKEHNFAKWPGGNTSYSPYDFGSVMHYDVCAFSINPSCAYIPNDPNEPSQRKTIVPVQCFTNIEATMGNRSTPTALDLQSMEGRYGPPLPLALLEIKRSKVCGTELLGTQQKIDFCDKPGTPCPMVAPPLLSATETFRDKWCDDGFMTKPSCRVGKEQTRFTQRKGARCGATQTNHKQHREYDCSCVEYQAVAQCHSGTNGVINAELIDYLGSKDPTKLAIGDFVALVQKGITDKLLAPGVLEKVESLLMPSYPSKSYARSLNRSRKRVSNAMKDLAKQKERKTRPDAATLSFDDVQRLVHQ